MELEVTAYAGPTLASDMTYVLTATQPMFINFNCSGVTEVNLANLETPAPDYRRHFRGGRAILLFLERADESTLPGAIYRRSHHLSWVDLGPLLTADAPVLTASDTAAGRQRFYRVVLLP